MKNYLKRKFAMRKYKNIVEASHSSNIITELSGIAVIVLESTGNRIESKFSLLGFVCFLLWYGLYFYCTYIAHTEDQTILRNIYTTKLKRYGDDFERIAAVIYVTYTMWKIPFDLSGDRNLMQEIIEIDTELKNLGEIVDHNKIAFLSIVISIGQVGAYLTRMFCIWLSLENLNVMVPKEKLFQNVYTDALSLILTSHYCFTLVLLRDRFTCINKVLNEIHARKSWEYKIFVRSRMLPNMNKVEQLQERNICDKIKACAKLYAMLYKATETINKMYGLALVLTLLLYLMFIILYMFYFMEATASGLFHDLKKYGDFLICVFWQISHALGIIYVNVYFSASTVHETRQASFIAHQIINSDFNSEVNKEALQFSVQLLHQITKFTAGGLIELNYTLFFEATRTVLTYLVIVLQFVTK